MSGISLVHAPLPDGCLVADTVAQVTTGLLDSLRQAGYRALISYLPLGPQGSPWDWDFAELGLALRSGIGVGFVQRCRNPGWAATAERGRETGRWAASGASDLGMPPGTLLWLDLEGVAPGTPPEQVEAYCEAWAEHVSRPGYKAGLYVGAGCGLDGKRLGALPSFHRYWDSLSRNPRPEPRGFCLFQERGESLRVGWRKVDVDRNRTATDAQGDRAEFLWMAERAPAEEK